MSIPEIHDVAVRDAVPADIPELQRIHAASVRELCAPAYGRDVAEIWASNPNMDRFTKILGAGFRCLLATCEGEVCGYGSIEVAKSQVSSLFVHPDWAGAGVGALLLGALERLATASGLQGLTVEASLNARGFYERHGYEVEETRRVRLSNGLEIDCVWMQKSF